MSEIKIAPSILAWDLGDLEGAIQISVEGGADQVHLDIIDGHFAPNITFGPGTVKALRGRCDLKFDTHLMIDSPQVYVDKFLEAGSDLLTFHAEVLNGSKFDDLYRAVNAKGREMGLAIKPKTEFPRWAADRLEGLHHSGDDCGPWVQRPNHGHVGDAEAAKDKCPSEEQRAPNRHRGGRRGRA